MVPCDTGDATSLGTCICSHHPCSLGLQVSMLQEYLVQFCTLFNFPLSALGRFTATRCTPSWPSSCRKFERAPLAKTPGWYPGLPVGEQHQASLPGCPPDLPRAPVSLLRVPAWRDSGAEVTELWAQPGPCLLLLGRRKGSSRSLPACLFTSSSWL